jgi:amino acid transporter
MLRCTTNQCTNDEFWFPLYNGEPGVIAGVGVLAAGVWVLLAVPLLVAGFVWLRGWRPRNWLRAAKWAGAWIAGLALMVVVVAVGGYGSDVPDVGWGELPIFAAWLALGAVMNQILPRPAHRGGGVRVAPPGKQCSAR